MRNLVNRGRLRGPRLFCAGRLLSVTTSTTAWYAGMYATADGPVEVRAATLGREADLGSLDVGRFAYVTGFADDPVRDIHVVRDVRLVVKEGEVMRNDLGRGQ